MSDYSNITSLCSAAWVTLKTVKTGFTGARLEQSVQKQVTAYLLFGPRCIRSGVCNVQELMSVKVAVYDTSEGWTSLVDYFNVLVNGSSRGVKTTSLLGDRTSYTTT